MHVGVLILWFILFCILPVLYSVFSLWQDQQKYLKSYYYYLTREDYKSLKKDKGKLGEYKVVEELERLHINENVFTNIYLFDDTGYSTEIDVVFVHTSGIYVLEVKNYSGWIYGNEKQKYWREVFYKKKFPFLNPIVQNNRHIDFLKKQLYITNNQIFKSYIVFTGTSSLKKVVKTCRDKYNTYILKDKNLISTIDYTSFFKENILTEEQVKKISSFLKDHTNMDPMIKQNHIDLLKRTHL